MAPHLTGRRGGVISDVILAAVVGAGSLAGHYLTADATGATTRPLGWVSYGLLALGAVALVARRRLPLLTLWVTVAAVVASFAIEADHRGPFVILPVMVALYTAAESGRRTHAVAAAGAIVGALGLLVLLADPSETATAAQGLLWATGWLAAAVVAGEVVKSRRDYLREVEARALEAERTREEEARRRAGEERLRIARELHDVLGHSLSLINVHAGTAAHVIDRQPAAAKASLETIRQASKQALDELRGTLGALQQDGEAAPRSPAPSLARIEDLTAPMSAAGLAVTVTVTGEPRPLPASLDQAAYRIVQESLTNVIRHAHASTATVALGYGQEELEVEVADAGAGVTDQARLRAGNGIAGMRERAAALGGDLQVSPGPGGVRVRARLPLEGDRSERSERRRAGPGLNGQP